MINILFLCTGNSCRSQMAEGLCRHYWGESFNIFSAGTKKEGLNKRAVKVMSEIEIDISSQYSKIVEELPKIPFDYVITVCNSAKDNCPYWPGTKVIHIGFDDPPALTRDMTNEDEIFHVYRRVRDEIEETIKSLPQILEKY